MREFLSYFGIQDSKWHLLADRFSSLRLRAT